MAKIFRVGIVGCGRVASLLEEDPLREKPATHAAAYRHFPRTKITAACDINLQRLARFRDRWNVPSPNCYRDHREMFAREKIDVVSIATWTETHVPIALAALENPHIKGIYLEKPIAGDLHGARRLVRACEKRKVKLLVGHERRFDANFARVKRMIDKRELGTLKTVFAQALSFPVPELPRKKYVGGALLHDGTHLMDLVLYFGGPAQWVAGFDKRPYGRNKLETSAFGVIGLKSGATVFVEGGGERKYFKFDLDLQFDGGRVVIGNGGIYVFRAEKSLHYAGFRELRPIPFDPPKKRENSFVGAVRELVVAIERDREPRSSGREACDALELILAIYASADKGGKKIMLGGRKGGG